jgi:hypothetical protein
MMICLHLHLPLFVTVIALCAGLSAGNAIAASATARQMPLDIVAPLLADDGSTYPSANRQLSAETTAGGPAPGWATQAQCHQLQRLHPDRVVRFRAAGQDLASQRPPARDAWVFVEGHGPDAVRLARRLAGAGVERVWVVLPDRVAATPAPAAQVTHRSQP